ncbi:ribonuclease J [Fusobacterium naviforme]|nr:RNase J family beta-CASP ribonuclease [Fusobacterium naviforme]PSL09329.1 ribonuclease J [Fusobacterium naviforme]STO27966.1 Ribonuclease J 1 [Fusobacterium naviforme]
MSENERNPLNAIRKLKELSRNLSQEAQGGRKDGAQKENAGKTTARRSSARKETGAQETVKKESAGKNSAGRSAGRKNSMPRKESVKKESPVKGEQKKESVSKTSRRRPRSAEVKESTKTKESTKAKESSRSTGSRSGARRSAKKTLGPLAAMLEHAKLPKARVIRSSAEGRVKIIPLGGLEQIGMNITAFECNDTIIVVDCGIAFPSEDMLGIDCVIPDVSYLKENISKVKGFVITHGHEDHIGALPYILKELNVPVYSTRLTIALIRHKLEEHRLLDSAKLFVVKHGDTVPFGDFNVEFIKTNHSISDSSALAIFSPAGVIFHTGDFKIDYTPVFGEAADLQRMAELGKQGVLALLCDSTNAIRPGFTMSERTVGRTFDLIFSEHKENRIIVATFASNVDRVQQVINSAYRYGRKVVVEGRSMVNVIGIANELGYIQIPEGTLIDIEQLKNYPQEKTVLITTGSQGESMAALSRMASGMHRKVSISPSDVVVMSSHPIPGNEKAVDKVINELSIKGAEVIFQDTHVSGHACAEEIKLMYSLLRPKFALPVHGEYRHRKAQVEIAAAVGVPKENILFMSTGDVVEISENSCRIAGHVQAGGIMVDGLGVGDVGNVVLRDRQNLAQNGIMIVTMALERGSNQLVSGPEIVSRGFVYVKDSEELMAGARDIAAAAVRDSLSAGVHDWSKLKNAVRDELSDFFWKKMKRNPVILPIILGVH